MTFVTGQKDSPNGTTVLRERTQLQVECLKQSVRCMLVWFSLYCNVVAWPCFCCTRPWRSRNLHIKEKKKRKLRALFVNESVGATGNVIGGYCSCLPWLWHRIHKSYLQKLLNNTVGSLFRRLWYIRFMKFCAVQKSLRIVFEGWRIWPSLTTWLLQCHA